MPSRRSDRGRMLASLLRNKPEQGAMIAEMTEPYGTIAAGKRIYKGTADPLDYLAAIPLIGAPARFAKGKKLAELMRKNSKIGKATNTVTDIGEAAPPPGMEHLKFKDEFMDPATRGDAILRAQAEGVYTDLGYLELEKGADAVKAELRKLKELSPEVYDELIRQFPEMSLTPPTVIEGVRDSKKSFDSMFPDSTPDDL